MRPDDVLAPAPCRRLGLGSGLGSGLGLGLGLGLGFQACPSTFRPRVRRSRPAPSRRPRG
eukprot:scaffold50010_cov36-Phaeocystis_antarctica.AAC.1